MIKTDPLISFYQSLIDESRASLVNNSDPLLTNILTLDINYFLKLISDRVLFINSHCRNY